VCQGCTGVADTATVTITIVECGSNGGGCPTVTAVDDVFENGLCEVTGNLAANDTLPENCTVTYRLIGSAEKNGGRIELNENGTFIFTARAGFDNTVTFEYEVCTACDGCEEKCARATVTIQAVCCDEIKLYELVTPNNDGLNDTWIIENIECYEVNSLKIFNRWGNLVYETDRYDNEQFVWKGEANRNTGITISSSGNRQLPDGTYFYLLDVRKGTNSQVIRGYVTIRGSAN
jgi:gliding motility-associated-like protein